MFDQEKLQLEKENEELKQKLNYVTKENEDLNTKLEILRYTILDLQEMINISSNFVERFHNHCIRNEEDTTKMYFGFEEVENE